MKNSPLLNSFIIGLVCFLGTACSHAPTAAPAAPKEAAEASPAAAPNQTPHPEFIRHTENEAYLAMNLPYPPYEKMLHQLEKLENIPALKSRGEAHITVISPVEYEKVLKRHLSMDEINKIAEEANIESTPFRSVCVGRGSKTISGHKESTYYVVVESPGLIDLRGKIEAAYIEKGGQPQEFVPEKFHGHITLGYTLRDLHYEDGVLKTKGSCIHPMKEFK